MDFGGSLFVLDLLEAVFTVGLEIFAEFSDFGTF